MGRICKKDIRIDFEQDVLYGSDLCNVDYPHGFPTVTFTLIPTEGLAERVWVDGYVHTPEERMSYEYTVGLKGYLASRVDSVIKVRCLGMWIFNIALDEKEQKTVYRALDEQVSMKLGYSCEELLKTAEEKMKGVSDEKED